MRTLPPQSEVVRWFEDDLFCQVNLWFACHLLEPVESITDAHLVRPNPEYPYSFGHSTATELVDLIDRAHPISSKELRTFAELWDHYRSGDLTALADTAARLAPDWPMLLPAIEAHRRRV